MWMRVCVSADAQYAQQKAQLQCAEQKAQLQQARDEQPGQMALEEAEIVGQVCLCDLVLT
jgi:hypothetical protein